MRRSMRDGLQKLEIDTSHHPRAIGASTAERRYRRLGQLPYMANANARAVRNRARYVRDGAGSLDWGLPRTRHNGEVLGLAARFRKEQQASWKKNSTSGGSGHKPAEIGQSLKPLLVHPSPSRPLLKTLDATVATDYTQHMNNRGRSQ